MTVKGKYLLEKYPGKGGWTYAVIPEITQDKKSPFGWVKVSGTIDGYQIDQVKLMPMGDGQLFLPLKKEIRKAIGKEAGDHIEVEIARDDTRISVPQYIIDCFSLEVDSVQHNFEALSEGEQKAYIDWVESAKKESTRTNRLAEMMRKLELNLKWHEPI